MSFDALRVKALSMGNERRVRVNQRLLIDKMLARYSSNFVIFRELLQNSDDALANSFHLKITCEPPQQHMVTFTEATENIGKFSSEKVQNVLPPLKKNVNNRELCERGKLAADKNNINNQSQFHKHIITEIRTINNGNVFNEDDWERIASIAEGNTNVDSVGQFGVGFFSVFSFSQSPIVTSGKQYLIFIWRDDDSLTTYRSDLPSEQQSQQTSVIMKMTNKYVLHTDVTANTCDSSVTQGRCLPNANGKEKVVPFIDLNDLKTFVTKGKICPPILKSTKFDNSNSNIIHKAH